MSAASDFSQRLFDTLDGLDVDGYVSLLAEDVVLQFGNQPRVEGRDAVRAWFRGHFAKLLQQRHRVLGEIAEGDALVQQLEVRIVRNNGAAGTVPAVSIVRGRDDGLIYDHTVSIDTSPIDTKLPVVPKWSDPATLEPKQVIAAFAEAVNTRNEPVIERLVAEDYLQHTRTIEDGRDSVEHYHTTLFERWPGMYVEVSDVLQEGNLVSAFSRIVLTEELGVDTANVWLIRDGQLAEHWEIADTNGAFDELSTAR